MAELNDVLERICNLVRAELRAFGADAGLQPVQLAALSFLAQCNRYSDTPQAVAEFLGLTKGTVSQSLKVLEGKGLIRKLPDAADRRVVHLKPTAKGGRLAERIPGERLARGLAARDDIDSGAVAATLREVLRGMQQANGLKSFGHCHSCRHHHRTATGFRCGLTQEPLSADDAQRICREHEYATATGR